MHITTNVAAASSTSWRDYAIRFIFGGAISVLAGFLAHRYGPVFGGLFLAFPAIFPASATLLEKHTHLQQRLSVPFRGRLAAARDARGAAMGSIGLMCFGLVVWKLLPHWNALFTLFVALALWILVSVWVWRFRNIHYVVTHFPHLKLR